MLLTDKANFWGFKYTNWDATPSATQGGLVTAGGSVDTESATPLVLATGANLSQDIYMLEIQVHTTSGTGTRNVLMDIGVDPAGGTSYTWIIENLVVGNAAAPTQGGGWWFKFPIFIKSGSQVAVRTQCSQASITCRVLANFFGQPSNPLMVKVGSFCETIGTVTNTGSLGQSITPGTTAWSTYVSLGTTVNPTWFWQISTSVNNGTITAEYCRIEIAWGDASNKHTILWIDTIGTTAEIRIPYTPSNMGQNTYCPVPAGANIYARAYCNGAPDTGYMVLAHGIGG